MGDSAKNIFKNTFKGKDSKSVEDSSVAKEKKKEVPKSKSKKKTGASQPVRKNRLAFIKDIPGYFSFIHTEEFRKTFGLTLLLCSAYLSIAFISFPFTWEADYSKVVGDLFAPEVTVNNWLGKLGALISHIFIYKWFGIASFLFPFLAFITGMRITFQIGFTNFYKIYSFSLFALLFSSVLFGYIIDSSSFLYIGGAYGYTMSQLLINVVGSAGTGILLCFVLAVFLVVAFNISFDLSKLLAIAPENEEESEEADNVVPLQENKDNLEETLASSTPIVQNTFSEKEAPEETDNTAELETSPSEEKGITSNIELNTESERHEIDEDKTIKEEEIVLSSGDEKVEFTVEKTEAKEEELTSEEVAEALTANAGEYDPTLDLASYQFPTIDLLESYGVNSEIKIDPEELNKNKDKILKTLADYKIEIEKIKATVGPTVTLYEIVPAAGVRISKIKNLEDDIALSLAALGIRIIAPIPGKGTIGIEVPNLKAEIVPMRTILASEKFQNTDMELPIALGKTISNETFIYDLAKMPHLLMAGATGQGKSVGLNAILVSLLYKKHPSQIKFVLVDPKKVELTLFNKIERHFLAKLPDDGEAIITDTKKVVHTLNSLCIEMDARYDLLKDAQVRNIKEYNTKFIKRKLNPNNGHRFLPYIVLVVDEFADLIMTAGKEVETPIARLAQLARAIGIHLIIATQRPSVNIITGTIKANFPARIAFRVTSKIDSRTILDAGGADQLIGRGDMLMSTGNDLIRLQCALVDTPEVDRICDFIGSQQGYPEAYQLPEYIDENGDGGGGSGVDLSERDSLFEQAAEIIVTTQQGSTSLLQRRLKLGYNRAGRIIDQLEATGIIGPFGGSKAREVLIKDILSLEQFLKDIDSK